MTFLGIRKETNLWDVLIVIEACCPTSNIDMIFDILLLGGDFHKLEASSTIFDVMIVMNSQNHVVVGPSPLSWSWRPVPTPEGDERPVIFCMTFSKSKDPHLFIFFTNTKEALLFSCQEIWPLSIEPCFPNNQKVQKSRKIFERYFNVICGTLLYFERFRYSFSVDFENESL